MKYIHICLFLFIHIYIYIYLLHRLSLDLLPTTQHMTAHRHTSQLVENWKHQLPAAKSHLSTKTSETKSLRPFRWEIFRCIDGSIWGSAAEIRLWNARGPASSSSVAWMLAISSSSTHASLLHGKVPLWRTSWMQQIHANFVFLFHSPVICKSESSSRSQLTWGHSAPTATVLPDQTELVSSWN